MGGTWHLTRRFFGSLRPGGRPSPTVWGRGCAVRGRVRPWARQYGPDRRHTVQVAREVEHRLGRDATRPVLAAALLHDIGKIDADLGTWGGSSPPLRDGRRPRHGQRWITKRGLAGRIGRYLQHPEIGADLLAVAGSAPLTVAWAKEHHTPAEAWTIDPAIGRVLFEVDDD